MLIMRGFGASVGKLGKSLPTNGDPIRMCWGEGVGTDLTANIALGINSYTKKASTNFFKILFLHFQSSVV